MKYTAKKNDGSKITLSSDDTFTLQFHEDRNRVESTPETLAEQITPESLLKIAQAGGQDGQKAAKALRIWIDENFD
jgi:hypothetical protein